MKKFILALFVISSLQIASEDLFGISAECNNETTYTIYSHNITDGTATILNEGTISCTGVGSDSSVDTVKGIFYISDSEGRKVLYDYINNTYTTTSNYDAATYGTRYTIPYLDESVSSIITTGIKTGGNSATTILGTLDISDANGNTMISYQSDGSVHIGDDSLVTIEENGVQQLYATNSTDQMININIKKGTDLLIDGVSVAGSLSTNATNIASNTTDIAANKTNIATNATDIAANKTNIATNVTNIAANTAEIATYTASISSNTTTIAALGSDLSAFKSSTNSQMTYMKSDYSSGIASAVAMSQFNLAKEGFSVGIGRGSYNDEDETAFGLGYGGEFKNGTLFKLQASKSGDASGVGLTISF